MPDRKVRDEPSRPTGRAVTPPPANNVLGAALLALSMLILTIEAALVRWMGPEVSIAQVIFFRSLAQLVMVGGICLVRGAMPNMRTGRLGLHFARAAGSFGNWLLYYWTFTQLDFSLATLLSFATSLFVIVLAGPVLGERVRAVSWLATLAGFAGVALASGAGTGAFDPAVFAGIAAAFCGAMVIFMNRTLTRSEDMVTILAYIALFILAASIPLAIADWRPISLKTGAMLLGMGLFGSVSMILTIQAYARGEAAALAPVPYVRIVFAMIAGYLVFAETPSLQMLAGAAIVVAAALTATHAEQRRRRRKG